MMVLTLREAPGSAEIDMVGIVGISGSLRLASVNTGLLRAAGTLLPDGDRLDIADISKIPLYDGDLEQRSGVPDAVRALKDVLAGADAILIATPEYNNSIPGVLKNAVDWASRPSADIPRVFGGKPVALMGASPGGFGTILAQVAWLPVLRTLGAELWTGGRLMVPQAGKAFDGEGNLIDEALRARLRTFLAGFAAFAADRR
jgi:chromate reductase, NAD(P)H dehydrogenase (quinone)